MNVQRACEAAIAMGNTAIAHEGRGVPDAAHDAFASLQEGGIIAAADARVLRNMVGFRNVAVHAHRQLNLDIVERVIDRELDTLARYDR